MIGELDQNEIEELLKSARIARLAAHPLPGNTHPLLVPIPCFYREKRFYVLSGPGQKIEAMRRNRNVTLEVDRFRATDVWESVVVQGWYEELAAEPERAVALATIEAISGESLAISENSILFQIMTVSASGRFERPE